MKKRYDWLDQEIFDYFNEFDHLVNIQMKSHNFDHKENLEALKNYNAERKKSTNQKWFDSYYVKKKAAIDSNLRRSENILKDDMMKFNRLKIRFLSERNLPDQIKRIDESSKKAIKNKICTRFKLDPNETTYTFAKEVYYSIRNDKFRNNKNYDVEPEIHALIKERDEIAEIKKTLAKINKIIKSSKPRVSKKNVGNFRIHGSIH